MASRELSPDVMGLYPAPFVQPQEAQKLCSGWHCVIMHVAVLGYEML